MNRLGEPEKIAIDVFEQLNPSVIVCLRDDPAAILERLRDRDGHMPVIDVAALQDSEIKHAEWVAAQLAVPIYCVTPDELPSVVKLLSE
jgi:adenylate kinase